MQSWGRRAMAVLALLFFVPPVQAFDEAPATRATSIVLPGHAAMDQLFFQGGLYALPGFLGQPSVADQMRGILANLQYAAIRPPADAGARARAESLWANAAAARAGDGNFFANVVPAPGQISCIDAETNAWALWAATELERRDDVTVAGLPERIAGLRSVLMSLLQSGSYQNRPACNTFEGKVLVTHLAVPLFVLLHTRNILPDPQVAATVKSRLDLVQGQYLRAGGFVEENDLYLATFNGQMLLTYLEAAQVYPEPAYQQVRGSLLEFLLRNLTATDPNGAVALELQWTGQRVEPTGGRSLDGQLWVGVALHNAGGGDAAGRAQALFSTFHRIAWSAQRGAYVGAAGVPQLDLNMLAAIFVTPPALSGVTTEETSLSIVVPSRPAFDYPLGLEGASLATGRTSIRFSLTTDQTGNAHVVLPLQELGRFDFSPDLDRLYGAPTLQRLGASALQRVPVPLATAAGPVDVLDFQSTLGPAPTSFRLDLNPGAAPVYSTIERSISLGLRNNASHDIALPSLELELDITNATVQRVQVNSVAVEGFSQVNRISTERLPNPHTRIVLPAILLKARSDTVVLIDYADAEPPVVRELDLSRDAAGRLPLPTATPVRLIDGETPVIRGRLTDNVLVRDGYVRYTSGPEPFESRLQIDADGRFLVQLPPMRESGMTTVRIDVIDAAGNLHSRPLVFEVRSAILSGSLVLFVFSGTLFATAFVIWLKVRRKAA